MDIRVLGWLLVVLLPRTFVSSFVIQSKVCDDLITYSNTNGHELFHINGNSLDKDSFCEALQIYHANGYIFHEYLGTNCCNLDLSIGRKLLKSKSSDEFIVPDHNNLPREERNDSVFLSAPKNVGVAASGAFLLCCVFVCPCFYKKWRETAENTLTKEPNSISSIGVNTASEKIPGSPFRVPPSPKFSVSPKLKRLGSLHLNVNQVTKATQNFSPSLRVGEGGFGTVYKAQLDDGQIVAVERAKREHFENLMTEFSSEVQLLAKIDHRNLVKLLGYIDKGNECLIITEYVPNGTLREHLDGQHGKILDFNQRLGIAIDVAHGLTYLHLYAEKPIIHRDVKSSNIHLTESMKAKVADFGFARLGPIDTDCTHISTKVKGTVGYLDPEYMRTYQLTSKSDVYSFGILLIEIVTGRRPMELKKPMEERVTLRWAFNKFGEGRVAELVDCLMEEVVSAEILSKLFDLAFQCAAPVRADRPDMKSVGQQLWVIRADYINSRKG